MSQSILIIDDEQDIRFLLKYNLEKEGYHVTEAENGKEGIQKAMSNPPDLILLDVMMPEMDGIETCEKIKEIATLQNVMICFLTARGEDYSQIAGFDAGGDDYITKPIKPKVLVSRISALLRRKNNTPNSKDDSVGKNSGITINREKYLVFKDGEEIALPRKEFELLALLMSKEEVVFQREVVVGDRTIDVHIRKLRSKIGEDCIQTIKGVGYKFIP